MEVKIDSRDPQNVPGEILARGLNVMLGYYKNPEATAETIDRDGWYHTGDLGTMDAYGNVYINGRSKNMLLGPSGQNIYPEEIEDKLNSMTMVVESLVVQRDNKLVALIYPDYEEAKNLGLSDDDLAGIMEQNRNGLNQMLPAYEKITEMVIRQEEFEKTPKRSIKRYLYQ
jgi:long-chain acyl-CoA synthetase